MAMNGAEERGTDNSFDSDTLREAMGGSLPQRTLDWGRAVTAFIVEHPELCLGIAFALGVAIGVAVKRR
jgi:ElaB/YqjD/DUF883 family membrane-anchored ribosome-binding protein